MDAILNVGIRIAGASIFLIGAGLAWAMIDSALQFFAQREYGQGVMIAGFSLLFIMFFAALGVLVCRLRFDSKGNLDWIR